MLHLDRSKCTLNSRSVSTGIDREWSSISQNPDKVLLCRPSPPWEVKVPSNAATDHVIWITCDPHECLISPSYKDKMKLSKIGKDPLKHHPRILNLLWPISYSRATLRYISRQPSPAAYWPIHKISRYPEAQFICSMTILYRWKTNAYTCQHDLQLENTTRCSSKVSYILAINELLFKSQHFAQPNLVAKSSSVRSYIQYHFP